MTATDITAVHPPGTAIAAYGGGQAEEYQAGIVMTPESAKALDDRLRACMTAVLREGVDYGVIPGTGGEPALLKPGAEKLLQWFGLSFTNDRQEIERDEDGRREGVNYRCTVTRALPDGRIIPVATCDSYAGYDEAKFYQSAEEMQAKAEEKERYWAQKDRRPPNPTRWQAAREYRAPWHNLLMIAQKRSIVGAAKYATAASGLFGDDLEDAAGQDDRETAAAPQDQDGGWPQGTTARPRQDRAAEPEDTRTWAERALAEAGTFSTEAEGTRLWREAAAAVVDGRCTPGQATHIQNRVTARITARRKEAAARILAEVPDDDPWRDKILGDLADDDEARYAISELGELSAAGKLDTDRARLLGRAVIARFPRAALKEPAAQTAAAGDDTRSQQRDGRQYGGEPARDAEENGAGPDPAAAGAAPVRVPQPLPPLPEDEQGPIEDEAGSISDAQLTKLHTVLTGLGYGSGDRDKKLIIAEVITGHDPLHGPFPGRSSRNLTLNEARKLIDTLDGYGGDRHKLMADMAVREQAADANG